MSRPAKSAPGGLEPLESRTLLSASVFRSYDGTGNNLSHSTWGAAVTDLLRLAPVAYADGVSSPALPQDQSARLISNLVSNQRDPNNPSQDLNTIDQNNLSDFGYAFGQFMDHDLDLTNGTGVSFPIAVPSGDPMGPSPIPFNRSEFDPATGTSKSNPRQQLTDITAYLDLSQVYGSDPGIALALRSTNGQLKTSPGNMLPYLNSTYFTSAQLALFAKSSGGTQNASGIVPTSQLFATGDVRGNENLELTAIQTVFMRNHNLIASKLHASHPTWSDEQLYQEARKINIAGYQAIVFNEWIPSVYGEDAMPGYTGYKSNVNPSISNEFATVAFRFGHSMVSPTIAREDNNGLRIGPDVQLSQDFFNPTLLNPKGVVDPFTGLHSTDIGPILKASSDGNGQAMDTMAVNDIRNLLFGPIGAGGEDLIARDIQRDRDNGVASYNTMRMAFGLPAVTSFAQITSNVQVQHELAQAYPGGVNTIDAFIGGIAEDHVSGSDVGPLFQAVMINQFTRLRDGDRFFYLNETMNSEESALFQQANSFSKVIEANTPLTNLQSNAMVFKASILGAVSNTSGGRMAGIKVTITDETGAVTGTTVTDGAGHYYFSNQTGVAGTGNYTVTLTLSSSQQVVSGPGVMAISRGDINLTEMNFTVDDDSSAAVATATPAKATSVFATDSNGTMAAAILQLSTTTSVLA
ncbi:MAG: peroxidase [Planctomycetota bacterium]|nr:peroxidase [Planctomycetota bacterium]